MSLDTVNQVGRPTVTGLTATGSTQATAFPLINNGYHEFTTVGSSTGAVLPTPKQLPAVVTVWNAGADTLSIYPPSGGTIDGQSANAAYSLSAGSGASLWAAGLSTWYAVTTATSSADGTVTSIATGTGLTGGPISTTGTVSLATIATGDLLANTSGGTAAPGATTLSALLDSAIDDTQGDILYRGASVWTNLAPGTSGDFLTTGGASANPSWTAGNAGTVTSVAAGTGLAGGTITSTGTLSLATITSHDVMANTTGGTAAPAGVTLSSLLDAAIDNTQGDILYRGSSTWTDLGPGTAGNVLQTGGASANPSYRPTSQVNVYTASSQTYTVPTWANFVRVQLIGSGGSGGSGGVGATSIYGATGGAAGGYVDATFRTADLTSTVTVAVGQAGSNAAGVTSGTGTNGGTGSPTSFGAYAVAGGGQHGFAGGTSAPTQANSGGNGWPSGAPGAAASITATPAAAGGTNSEPYYQIGAGGSGGGITSGGAALAGGSGGSAVFPAQGTGTTGGGANTGANAGNGSSGGTVTTAIAFGSGGGGGGGIVSGTGGSGGNGGSYGAGGGGGGSSTSGTSGAGGAGAAGIAVITAW